MKKLIFKIKQYFQSKKNSQFFYVEEELKYQKQHENEVVRARLEKNKAS